MTRPDVAAARQILWLLAFAAVVITVGVTLALREAIGQDTQQQFGPQSASTPVIKFRSYCDNASPPNCDQIVNVRPARKNPDFGIVSTGTALTPVVLWPTPTAGATPGPTAPSFDGCTIRNPSSNTASVWVCHPGVSVCVPQTTSGTPGPVNGIELKPGEAIAGLPTVGGGCGEYTIVRANATPAAIQRVRQ